MKEQYLREIYVQGCLFTKYKRQGRNMVNDIGVFICNYNGKEWVMKCIDSLLKQSFRGFDIYVIDNASTDGTVESIQEKYGAYVSVICNAENMGGSGGFDKGLKIGLENGYQYISLLDNDIVLDKDAIKNMRDFLQLHDDVGIVGSQVMILEKPDTVQDFGARLDFHRFKEFPEYCGETNLEKLPLLNECDYVPTCAVMIRAEALKKSGTMPVDNFIYYDDIELSHKMVLKGYRVVALGNVKVWHKGGFRKGNENTFSRYYFLRNRLHFFAKYIQEEDIGRYIDTILAEIFSQLYGFNNKGMKELYQTTVYALDDFLHEVRGKADNYKVMPIVDRLTPFENIIVDKSQIRFLFIDNFHSQNPLDIFHIFLYIIKNIQNRNLQKNIWVSLKQCSYRKEEFKMLLDKAIEIANPEFQLPKIIVSENDPDGFDLELKMCEHVKMVKQPVFPLVYVDKYCNCIVSDQDYEYFKSYMTNEQLFMETYRPLAEHAVKMIRKRVSNCEG